MLASRARRHAALHKLPCSADVCLSRSAFAAKAENAGGRGSAPGYLRDKTAEILY